jgi:hypothetical protein
VKGFSYDYRYVGEYAMSVELRVFGDFPLQTTIDERVRTIESIDVRAFTCSSSIKDIINSCGCYVFCMRHGENVKPWYVGKATVSFRQECFTPHKIAKYNKALALKPRALPCMFFVARSNGDALSERIIGEIEKFLIAKALVQNKKILNRHHTGEPEWRISGAVRARPGESSRASSLFSTALGLTGR